MKVFFNTKAFDCLSEKHKLDITTDASEAELAVLGAKTIKFSEFRNLKAIYRFGVGHENIPADLIKKGTPPVFFPSEQTKKILYESTVNFTVFLVFHMYYLATVGLVDTWEKYTRNFLTNQNLLVIGLGNIGNRVAEKMKQFMNVNTYDTQYNKYSELRPLVETADIITLHIPLSDKTRNFIDSEKLSWMRDDAILINTARGGLVDDEALYQKIVNSRFRAAFDVFWHEPYNGKLKSLGKSKFFMTPHTSSQTIEYIKEGFKDTLRIIKKLEAKI